MSLRSQQWIFEHGVELIEFLALRTIAQTLWQIKLWYSTLYMKVGKFVTFFGLFNFCVVKHLDIVTKDKRVFARLLIVIFFFDFWWRGLCLCLQVFFALLIEILMAPREVCDVDETLIGHLCLVRTLKRVLNTKLSFTALGGRIHYKPALPGLLF